MSSEMVGLLHLYELPSPARLDALKSLGVNPKINTAMSNTDAQSPLSCSQAVLNPGHGERRAEFPE